MTARRPLRARLRAVLTVLLSIALATVGLSVARAAAANATLLAAVAPYQVLVFSKTAGFRHDSIAQGITAIQQLGAANSFTVVATEDAAAFTDANLAAFATVVFLSTTGDVLNPTQQAAFERYIRAGGGFVGVHAAADTEYDWPWYGGLVGAYFNQHPAIQAATVKVEDPAHPSTAGLPALWTRTDEWYNFRTNPRGAVHVLASLDEKTYAPGTGAMGADHPITWCQDYDGGRSWYTGLGHDGATYNDAQFRTLLVGGIASTAGAAPGECGVTKPNAFEKVTLDSNTANPMELDIAADGRVFYIERDGRVQIIKPATGTTVTAIDLDVFSGNEDGLLGLRLDPNFATNGWLYLYYSPSSGSARNQISRFTVAGDTIALNTERVVLQVPTQRNTCCHQGGSMTFDSAGNLYLATGDNTNPFEADGFAPIDERAGRQDYDAQRTSGNTNDLRGKILRIRPATDGTYTVPAGNLFAPGTANTRAEIYAMGFRNPFRIGVDRQTNTLLVADYGPDAQSTNPNRGPEGTVEWNIVRPGNYGWPYCMGANQAFNDWTFPSGPSGPKFNCAAPVNNSPNNTGQQNLPAAIGATVDYDFSGNPLFPEIGGGGAPMAGPVYRYNASLASDRKWPAYYDGKAIFGEWNQNKLYTFQVNSGVTSVVDINQLLPSMSFKRPMDMEFGPDGALYLIEWGSGFGGNNDDSGVYRIDFISGGRAPIAVASGTPTTGPVPLTAQFSSAGSRDPDGQAITYAWTFGDGTGSTAANPSHTYTTGGSFNAQLVVTDTEGRTGVANVPISVGNTAPTVTITSPPEGGIFNWGDTIRYTVTVTDPEDGAINCARVNVTYSLGHDEHAHGLLTNTGCTGTFQTTTASGHGSDANIFGVIEATYTDDGGTGGTAPQTGRHIIVLQPKLKQAEYFSATGRAPGGIGGGDPGVVRESTGDTAGGLQNIGFIEDGDYWSMSPASLTGITGVGFRVASPGGGRIEVHTGSASGPLVATATVPVTPGWQSYTDITTSISGQSAGTTPLFFVAKNPVGGTNAGGLFNVNWMTFSGPGIANNSQLTLSPTSLAFGSVALGAQSAVQTVTVTNPGPGAASINGITVNGQYTQTNNCPVTLAAAASCAVSVRFAPTSAGAQAGLLSVANSTTSTPLTVSLSGTGTSGSTNLALGATMSASSAGGGFPAANANDNNTSSYWESANSAFPQWLQADLGSAQQIGSITITLPPSTSWATRTQTLSVEGSTNGSTWTILSASAGRTFNPATGNSVDISLPTSTVRYLRLMITANTGWPAGQVSELRIFSGGGGGSPTLSPSPSSVAFGNQTVGTTSAARTVTITNTGAATASLSGITASAQFGQTNTCGSSLAAGASCTVNVTFAPTSVGAANGNLTVSSNASNPTLTVGLTGTGTSAGSATLAANPSSVAFGDQTVGTTSATRTVTITNSGTVAASISGVSAPAQFGQANTCGSSLAAGASCTANVTFAPTSAGAKSGNLTVSSNASNPTLTVALTGTGTTTGTATLAANPSSVAFGDQTVGTTSAARAVTITNSGTVAASISGVSAPAQFGQTNTCGSSLAAGASCTANVTFAPTSAGGKSGNLTVSSNASNPTLTVALSGNGTTTGPVNLALNKPVTANSNGSFVAANAVDSDVSSYWESPNNAFPQSFTVDLAAAASLTSVVLRVAPAWGSRAQTLSVLGSTNNSTYTTVVSSAAYLFPAGGAVTIGLPAGTNARYVRLTFTANTGWPAAQLSDLQVMGTGGGGGGGDLALNKPVTVTSVTQAYAGTNAVDGNDNTYWESAPGFPQSIIIDLGSVQTVSSVVVKVPPPAAWATRTQTLTVAGSTNGTTYTNVAGPTAHTFNPATGNTVTITFPPTQMRYVRVTFTSNSGSSGAQAATVSVFGPTS